jgi:hypothetical protein
MTPTEWRQTMKDNPSAEGALAALVVVAILVSTSLIFG